MTRQFAKIDTAICKNLLEKEFKKCILQRQLTKTFVRNVNLQFAKNDPQQQFLKKTNQEDNCGLTVAYLV